MEIKKLSLFELVLIILICVFLYFYIANSDIGRFQLDTAGRTIIDTKTGQTFTITSKDRKKW